MFLHIESSSTERCFSKQNQEPIKPDQDAFSADKSCLQFLATLSRLFDKLNVDSKHWTPMKFISEVWSELEKENQSHHWRHTGSFNRLQGLHGYTHTVSCIVRCSVHIALCSERKQVSVVLTSINLTILAVLILSAKSFPLRMSQSTEPH